MATETETKTIERTVESRALTDLSPSRFREINKCGLSFKYTYVDKLIPESSSSAMVFGNVIHHGVADWYGHGPTTEKNQDQHRNLDLVNLVRSQWPKLIPKDTWQAVEELIELDQERMAVAQLIKVTRDVKAPMQTKAFRESEAQQQYVERHNRMLAEIEEAENEVQVPGQREDGERDQAVRWSKTEDPFTAYKRSEDIARRLQAEWQEQPRPLFVEEPFRLQFGEFIVRGQIDQLRLDVDLETGEPLFGGPRISDMKSGQQPMTPMEAFIQVFIYWEAYRQIREALADRVELPDTNLVELALVRLTDQQGRTKIQRGRIDPERHPQMARNQLEVALRRIQEKDFGPRTGMWCKSCNFNSLCAKEINLWSGDGTISN